MFWCGLGRHVGSGVDRRASSVTIVLDLTRVYELYVDRVYAFFAYRLAVRAEAEDLTAATFERLVRNVDRFDEARGSLATWIFTIAENVLIDHYRRQGRRDEQALPDGDDGAIAQLMSVDRPSEGLAPALQQALEALSPRERHVIGLRFGGDLSGREIAGLLGTTEANAHQVLSRALRRLRQQLGDVTAVR
jgi:RNA polymerase sigma factor (sigma-70 family)